MAQRSKIAGQAFDLSESIVRDLGLDLIDVEYKKEGQFFFLRFLVDKKGGVSIEDCELVSRTLDPLLEKSLSVQPDFFEVSSPGLTRPLSTIADYERYQEEALELAFYQLQGGFKHVEAKITAINQDLISLHILSDLSVLPSTKKTTVSNEMFEKNELDIQVSITDIALAKRVIKF